MTTITRETLNTRINKNKWQNSGDGFERMFYSLTETKFPLLERFWQLFVVPSTLNDSGERVTIRQHDAIPPKIAIIGNHNYVMFQHIFKCYSLIGSSDYFSIDDFYTHLVGVLDNFEQLFEKLNFILQEYGLGTEPIFLKKLTRDQFLENFERFYDENYQSLHENYKSKGRLAIELQKLSSKNLLEQVYGKVVIKKYFEIDNSVRQTRNLFVHGVRLGSIIDHNRKSFIPKHQYVHKYKDDYRKVFEAKKDIKTFREEFIEAKLQMKNDLELTMEVLNELYKHITDMIEINNLPAKYLEDNYSIILKQASPKSYSLKP